MTWGELTTAQLNDLQIGFADRMEGCSQTAISQLRHRRCNMPALLGWLDGEMARIKTALQQPGLGMIEAQRLHGERRAFNAFIMAIRDGIFHHPAGQGSKQTCRGEA